MLYQAQNTYETLFAQRFSVVCYSCFCVTRSLNEPICTKGCLSLRQQSNIVSFDEACRSVRGRNSPYSRYSHGGPWSYEYYAVRDARHDTRYTHTQHEQNDLHPRTNSYSAQSVRFDRNAPKYHAAQGAEASSGHVNARNIPEIDAPAQVRTLSPSSTVVFDRVAQTESPHTRPRPRSRSRVSRRFSRMYGSSAGTSDSTAEENIPRAAVYKGQMGSSQRKAARMQDEHAGSESLMRGTARSASHGLHAADGYSSADASEEGGTLRTLRRHAPASSTGSSQSPWRHFSPRVIIACFTVICIVLGCAFLYAPAREYYQQVRERDRLAVEYDELQTRNDTIQSQVDALATDSGVEDKAREELGWVTEGETAGVVMGLDSGDGDPSTLVGNVSSDSIKAPETWYSRFLDPLFGVD